MSPSALQSVARATGLLARIALWVAAIGLVAMTAMIACQVFWRYVLNDSIIWTEPASVMVMGWFIFLGAAVGIREGYHLSFDVLLYFLPDSVVPWLHSLSDIAVGAFGLGMIWFGTELAVKTGGNMIPSLGISGAFDFLPIVAGGVLVVLFSAERIVRRAAGLQTARFGEEAEID
ncbi:TRAP transporter small permease [uncultured Jannaschia sp.]|uniref:TRAP transporter small permease n=1 Tax=uncultured Jannaschia sp. TaxID=293347 RepID=UPI002610B54E|nr:TRAP transporter small permease [uncultured Jannaschia sp.]